jgi:SnoaL-like domain
VNNIREAIYNYFKGLETGNVNMIMDVFSDNAMVHSPLYGDQPAALFYTKLFADTRQSDITLLNIFESVENNYTAAVHFKYHWILADGTPTHFECVDIFKFDENGKVADMTITYDTAKLRPAFEALSKG